MSAFDLVLLFAFIGANIFVAFRTRGEGGSFDKYADGRGTDLKDYTIVATCAATMCSASLFWAGVEQVYLQGFFIIFSYLIVDMFAFLVMIIFFIPRLIKIETITIMEWVGIFYGDKIRSLFALCETFKHIGRFAIQLRLIATCSIVVFGIDESIGDVIVWVISFMLLLYSVSGGIKAVSITDVIQSLFFVTIIPIIAIYIWNLADSHDNFTKLFSGSCDIMSPVKTFSSIAACVGGLAMLTRSTLSLPMNFVYFQRVRMCESVSKARKIFSIATIIYGIVIFFILFIGLQLRALSEGIDPNTGKEMTRSGIMPYMMSLLSGHSIFKILVLASITSLSISTADSEINAMSSLLTNDFLCIITRDKVKRTRTTAAICAFVGGLISIFLALRFNDIFKLLMTVQNFFLPIVIVPLVLLLFGFRTRRLCIWSGICGGIIMTIIFPFLLPKGSPYAVYAFGPGMFANAVGILVSHWLVLKRRGKNIRDDEMKKLVSLNEKLKICRNFLLMAKNRLSMVKEEEEKKIEEILVNEKRKSWKRIIRNDYVKQLNGELEYVKYCQMFEEKCRSGKFPSNEKERQAFLKYDEEEKEMREKLTKKFENERPKEFAKLPKLLERLVIRSIREREEMEKFMKFHDFSYVDLEKEMERIEKEKKSGALNH